MKFKAILAAAALLVSTGAFAENYVTAGAGANWFVGAGAGMNATLNGAYAGGAAFTSRLGLDLNFGKWVTPEFGFRVDYNGHNVKYGDNSNQRFHALGIAFLWDITNTFKYNPTRVLSVVPYAQVSYIYGIPGSYYKDGCGVGAGFGMSFPIRLSSRFYIIPDAHALFTRDNIFEQDGGIGTCAYGSATLGLQYRFGRQGFKTADEYVAPFILSAAEAEAARQEAEVKYQKAKSDKEAAEAKLAKLEAQTAALGEEVLANAAANAEIVENLMKTTSYVYFEIGQATLSVKELAHFDYLVKTKISQGKNLTFTLAGNADKNTGSKWYNQQLSKQRANYIYKLLTTKYGLSKDQFVVKANGGNNYSKTIQLNRAVIIDAQ